MKNFREKLRISNEGTFTLQITSMVDIFTIILIFMLKSYSTSAVQITPSANLKLPMSSSTSDPIEGLKLIVSKVGIFVDDKEILKYEEGKMGSIFTDKSDPKFIPELFKALDEQAKKSQEIRKVNNSLEFDGKVIVQADQDLNYDFLKKVMYTSMLAGFSDIRFAVLSKGE